MPYSMTGFSKIEMDSTEGKIYGEARSLNSRYLELNLKLPRIDSAVELRLREMVRRYVNRGKVDITLKWERPPGFSAIPKMNEENVGQYVELIAQIKERFGISGSPTVENVLNFRDVISYEEGNGLSEAVISEIFENLLVKLNEERAREGALIYKDLMDRIAVIEQNLSEIEELRPLSFKIHEERLKEKVLEATRNANLDEVRVLQELVVYMERLDIAEETVRLRGHIGNFRKTLESKDPVGRKLDFIIQEMVRETNTIGSKANDLAISERVIQIKVEVEKMREQVQNTE
jgi:uncharacterized protein (TIGR00255 family)